MTTKRGDKMTTGQSARIVLLLSVLAASLVSMGCSCPCSCTCVDGLSGDSFDTCTSPINGDCIQGCAALSIGVTACFSNAESLLDERKGAAIPVVGLASEMPPALQGPPACMLPSSMHSPAKTDPTLARKEPVRRIGATRFSRLTGSVGELTGRHEVRR